jgi:hypothetical protein
MHWSRGLTELNALDPLRTLPCGVRMLVMSRSDRFDVRIAGETETAHGTGYVRMPSSGANAPPFSTASLLAERSAYGRRKRAQCGGSVLWARWDGQAKPARLLFASRCRVRSESTARSRSVNGLLSMQMIVSSIPTGQHPLFGSGQPSCRVHCTGNPHVQAASGVAGTRTESVDRTDLERPDWRRYAGPAVCLPSSRCTCKG